MSITSDPNTAVSLLTLNSCPPNPIQDADENNLSSTRRFTWQSIKLDHLYLQRANEWLKTINTWGWIETSPVATF